MSNRGTIPGASKDGWRDYTPEWVGLVHSGGTDPSVQPSIGNGSIRGRYNVLPNGLVIVKFALLIGSTTTLGTGDELWAFGLPLPIYRWQGSALNPVGDGIAWQGASASPSFTVPVKPSYLNDAVFSPFGVGQGRNDYYFGFHCGQAKKTGTGSIAGSNTSTTITHGLGYTPSAWDIQIVGTGLTSGSTWQGTPWIDTITSTQFNVNLPVAPGTSKTWSFSWKADAVPGSGSEFNPEMLGSTKPFAWASGNQLGATLIYEARS